MSTRWTSAFVFGIACLLILSGCEKANNEKSPGGSDSALAEKKDNYDPHDVPITDQQKEELRQQTAEFPAAVTKVKDLCSALQQETSAGIPENPYIAHQALDKADLVLGWLPEIAKNSEVPKEHWEELNTTANDLRTLLEQVHQNIDDQKDPDFKAVAHDIAAKLDQLQRIATVE